MNNSYIKNIAFENGAALYILDGSGTTIINRDAFIKNEIIDNGLNTYGSTLYLQNSGNISVLDSLFDENKGVLGGAIYFSEIGIYYFYSLKLNFKKKPPFFSY